MKARQIIEALQTVDPDTEVLIHLGNARTRSPFLDWDYHQDDPTWRPRVADAFEGGWGYVLPADGYAGGREAQAKGKTHPAVWL